MGKILKNAIVGNIPFYVLSGIAMLMLIISWIMPPAWKIDTSVILSTSEIFAFAGLWTVIKAIDKGVDASITHKDTTLTIDGKNDGSES